MWRVAAAASAGITGANGGGLFSGGIKRISMA